MSTANTKKEAARVIDGLVAQTVKSHGGVLDADTARGLVLMALKTVSVRRAVVEATNPREKPTDAELCDLLLPAKKPGRKVKADPAGAAAATNAAAAAAAENDDDEGDAE